MIGDIHKETEVFSASNTPLVGVGAIHKMSDVSLAPEQPKDEINKSAIYNIAKGLPTAGALAGGMISMAAAPGTFGATALGAPIFAGAGAATGKAVENIILSAIGAKDAPETVLEGAGEVIKEGALTSIIDRVGGNLISKMANKAKPAFAQALKAFEGIDERSAFKVLNDPDILLRAKPMPEASKEFGDFIEKSGYKYGKDAVEEAFGVFKLSEPQSIKLINRTIKRIGQVKGLEKFPENKEFIKDTVQDALAGRYELSNSISKEFARGAKDEARSTMQKLEQVDDWLETQIPGFRDVRKTYSEAKIAESFSPFLPTNKNGSVSVLRTLSALGASVLNPYKGIPYLLASSPFVGGTVLKGVAKTVPASPAIGASISNIAAKGASAIVDKLTEPKHIEINPIDNQKKDESSILDRED